MIVTFGLLDVLRDVFLPSLRFCLILRSEFKLSILVAVDCYHELTSKEKKIQS